MSEPEPWQTNAPGPWMTIEGTEVAVWALPDGRHRVVSPERSQEIDGHDQAVRLAHEWADE